MKKLTLLVAAFLIVISATVTAQKPFSGTIKMKSQITGTEDPNVIANTPPEMETIVFGNKSKLIIKSEQANISVVVDGDTKKTYQIFDIPSIGVCYFESTEAELKSKQEFVQFKYEYLDEEKVIVGYTCKKVKLTITDLETDEEESVVFYVTKEISATDALNFTQFPGLVGFPLRIESSMEETAPGAMLIMEASEITLSELFSETDFALPANAKNIMENEELKTMFGITEEK